MKPFISFLCTLLYVTGITFGASSTPVALLSVATEAATLDVATPESRRPVFTPAPEPYLAADLEKLSDIPLARAMAANERVKKANAKSQAVFDQETKDRQEKRENAALHELSLTDLGKAVIKAPGFFRDAVSSVEELSVLPVGEDGYFNAPEDACLVRLYFNEPRKSANAAEVPGTSNVPVTLTMTVTVKIESTQGETVQTKTFDQTESYSNSDKLLGPAYAEAVERLVRAAVIETVSYVSSNRKQSRAQSGRLNDASCRRTGTTSSILSISRSSIARRPPLVAAVHHS